jgi:uncharacterized protein (DUF488 family)
VDTRNERVRLTTKRTAAHRSRVRKKQSAAFRVFTVGYEGRDLDEVVAILREADIDRVIDVRELPLSRRRGFSKTPLSEALASAGIEYVHLRIAGNPFRGQRADVKRCLALYQDHLDRSPEVISAVLETARGHRAALLCVEREACNCHRSVIALRLVQQARVQISDL